MNARHGVLEIGQHGAWTTTIVPQCVSIWYFPAFHGLVILNMNLEIYFCIKLFLTEEKRCPVKLKDWLVDKKPNKSHPSEALHRLLDKVILTCDHPPHGVVCVLAHELVCGREATIAFLSRTLAASERKYAQIEREIRHRCCH
ncbi:Retrovirus-related Pol polyprotein from transposon opus [Trichinella spiralis]|uniref:Retrovirus-related Pol polyprotein from transposon opus n=1 Tax=Trichinella spiralis TaxID=6334 RepID=A0ABR3KKY8_TRISP